MTYIPPSEGDSMADGSDYQGWDKDQQSDELDRIIEQDCKQITEGDKIAGNILTVKAVRKIRRLLLKARLDELKKKIMGDNHDNQEWEWYVENGLITERDRDRITELDGEIER